MTDQPRQQHTLSRFYIARFGDAAEKPSKNPNVWYYPLDESHPRTWRRERAKQVSVRRDYYTEHRIPDEGKYGLEKALKLSEDWAAEPIAKVCDGRNPTPEDIHTVALFMTTTMARAPAYVGALGALRTDTTRKAMRSLYGRVKKDPEEHARVVSQLQTRGLDPVDLRDPETFNPDRVRFVPSPASAAQTLIEAGTDLTLRLVGMVWLVFRTTKDEPFITSDVPLCPSADGPTVDLTFPLSSRIALYLRDHPAATNGGRQTVFEDRAATAEFVSLVNHRTARRAQEFLLSSRQHFPGHDQILEQLKRGAAI